MNLPNHFDIVQQIAAKFGLPDNGNDAQRRLWTDRVAETLAAKFPGENWGRKSSSPTNPVSADVVCIQAPGWFEGADILNGTNGQLCWDVKDLTGQHFIPVTPKDWLAVEPPAVPLPPTEPNAEEGLDLGFVFKALLDAILDVRSEVEALSKTVEKAAADIKAGVKIRF